MALQAIEDIPCRSVGDPEKFSGNAKSLLRQIEETGVSVEKKRVGLAGLPVPDKWGVGLREKMVVATASLECTVGEEKLAGSGLIVIGIMGIHGRLRGKERSNSNGEGEGRQGPCRKTGQHGKDGGGEEKVKGSPNSGGYNRMDPGCGEKTDDDRM